MKIVRLVSKIAFVVFAVLYAVLQTGLVIAVENRKVISATLGQRTYKIVNDGGEEGKEYYTTEFDSIASLKESGEALAEEIEGGGAVLLKNENGCLPLDVSEESKVSLFGSASADPVYSVTGSAKPNKNATPAIDVKSGLESAGFKVNPDLYNFYKKNTDRYSGSYNKIADAAWKDVSSVSSSFSGYSDAAIMVLKRTGGENGDLSMNDSDGENGNYLAPGGNEKSVLKGLADLKGSKFKKIIVILNSSNPIEAEFINDPAYKIDAVIWAGATGQCGFGAIGKILSGEINPSGRLSDTYWNKHFYNPATVNFGAMRYENASSFPQVPEGSGTSYTSLQYTAYLAYEEGIYVGYRYAETRYYDVVTGRANAGEFDYDSAVAYPFGYGLSYTQFDYSDVKVTYDRKTDEYTATVKVTNSGNVAGREVVQLYVGKPYTSYDIENHVEKSAVELVGFAKTDLLEEGESQTVTMTVNGNALASYDAYGVGGYIVDAGDYYFTVAAHSHAAVNNVLAAEGKLPDGADGKASDCVKFGKDFDAESYADVAKNEFGFADPLIYENAAAENEFGYITRNDWQGTVPLDRAKLYLTTAMADELLAQDSENGIEADDGEYPVSGNNAGLQLVNMREDSEGKRIDYDDAIWDEFLDQLTFEDISSLIVSGMRSTAEMPEFGKPATVDHNGPTGLTQAYNFGESGLANKYGDADSDKYPTYYPCIGVLASTFDSELAARYGTALGEDALWAGYSGLYGIGINIHRTAYDGRFGEYYSEDPHLSGVQAANVVTGLQSKGCNAYVKHVAVYEQQNNRVGMSVWLNEQSLREIYLSPFKIAIENGGAMNAMVSYSRLGVTLCPASKSLCTDFIKRECGMKGLIVTDMWKNRYKDGQLINCLMAGCDLPDGELSADVYSKYAQNYSKVAHRMRDAAKRVLYSVSQSNAMNGYSSSTRIIRITPKWEIALTAVTAVSGVLFGLSVCACAIYPVYGFIMRRRTAKQSESAEASLKSGEAVE